MTPTRTYAKKQAKAMKRRRLNAKERHEHQQRQAQRDIEALHQALHDLGLPEHLVIEIEGRLRSQKTLLGKIFGLMVPTLFGCINAYELGRTRGWAFLLATATAIRFLPRRSTSCRIHTTVRDRVQQ